MEMRRMDKAMDEMTAKQVLTEGIYGILATVGEDGYPYGVPMNYVYEDGSLYFHGTTAMGHRNQNLAKSEMVCFTVVRNTQVVAESFNTKFESVIVFGRIREAKEKKTEIFKKLLEKYSSDYMVQGAEYMAKAGEKAMVYEMTVERMTGKAKY